MSFAWVSNLENGDLVVYEANGKCTYAIVFRGVEKVGAYHITLDSVDGKTLIRPDLDRPIKKED